MAVTVVSTVGGASSNSYVETSYVDTYAESTAWASEWDAKTDDEKAALVVRATRAVDRIAHRGRPASDTQALLYPRTEQYRPSGTMWATDAIPTPVKDATALVAAWLASKTADPFGKASKSNVKMQDVPDVLRVEYFGPPQPEGDVFLSEIVVPMLAPHGLIGGSTVRLTR